MYIHTPHIYIYIYIYIYTYTRIHILYKVLLLWLHVSVLLSLLDLSSCAFSTGYASLSMNIPYYRCALTHSVKSPLVTACLVTRL